VIKIFFSSTKLRQKSFKFSFNNFKSKKNPEEMIDKQVFLRLRIAAALQLDPALAKSGLLVADVSREQNCLSHL
jgi:hypothetical protein